MHIPKTFGGGFIHHDVVHERNVEMMFQRYINLRKKERFVNSIIKGEGAEKAREESKRIEIDTLKKKWWF